MLLTIQRSQYVSAPGRICFPGGGIEPGESELETLMREMYEELGVAIKPRRRLWRSTTRWGVDLVWWHVDVVQDTLYPNPTEIHDVHWLTIAQLRAEPRVLESNLLFLDAWQRGEFVLEGLSET